MKCVYCNEIIIKASNEHIIQNALGGELQGNEICCDDCNKKISQLIDKPFTDHFKTILMFFPNLKKMNNQNSSITINAIGQTIDGEEFDVIVKNKKITSSPEFQSKYKKKDLLCFTSFKSELFKINDQEVFFTGIRKIAFNYAIYNKIEFEKLKNWVLIETEIENGKRRLKNVIFKQPLIPYYPLNDFEEFIENQNAEMLHSLLLFSKDNKLWCYVNLFNTFKYYVLLSEEIPLSKKINKSYCQLVQKINHDTSFVKYRKTKQKMILAEEFNVDINLSDEDFIKIIKTIISKKNRQIDYYKYINNLSTNTVELYHWIKKYGKENLEQLFLYLKYYTDEIDNSTVYDENERFINKKYKELILISNGKEIAYPEYLFSNFDEDKCRLYCTQRLHFLCNFLQNGDSFEEY